MGRKKNLSDPELYAVRDPGREGAGWWRVDRAGGRGPSAVAKPKVRGKPALDAALLAWALKQNEDEGAQAALDRARELAKKQPGDSLLKELLGE